MATKAQRFTLLSVLLCTVLIGALLVSGSGVVSAQTAASARAHAFGVRVRPDDPTPQVTAVVPPSTFRHQEQVLLAVPPGEPEVEAAEVVSDVCINPGVPASLQPEINTAQRGGAASPSPTPATQTTTATNPTATNPCVTPTPGGPNRVFLPLWNARGYANATEVFGQTDVEAEAVARCVGTTPTVATGARFSDLTANLQGDPSLPNQRLNPAGFGLAETAIVTFWETNWDPRTGTTTDGTDTVYVNGLHIKNGTQDIIISHAEASVTCPTPPASPSPTPTVTVTVEPPPTTPPPTTPPPQPGPTPPPGGFPRDITFQPSKRFVTFGRTFSLAGAVTPATEHETPRACIEGVNVTIRRDPVGGSAEFTDVGTVRTDSDGNFSFNFIADANSQWLAFIEKDNPVDCAQVASDPKPVLVRPSVLLRVSDKTPRRGAIITFTIRLRPCPGHEGTRVKLRQAIKGRQVIVAQRRLDSICQAAIDHEANFKRAVFDASWSKQDGDHQNGFARPKVIRTHRRLRR